MPLRTDRRDNILTLIKHRPLVMGVLNVTPDSFYDGSRYASFDSAVARAQAMIEEGADIIDIGAESTRPGADAAPEEIEAQRAWPVVEAVAQLGAAVSIDTRKSSVAQGAVERGACIINDVSAMTFDENMGAVAADSGAIVVLMHAQGDPKTMQQNPVYGNVVREICEFLSARVLVAQSVGIPPDHIWIDPGIGFGKNLEHNLQILDNIGDFCQLGYPALVGASRKSFIGKLTDGLPPEERLEGSLAAAAIAVYQGASIIRTHDPRATKRAIAIASAIRSA